MPGIDVYTKLCLHGEGTDASTVIADSSLSPKAVTAAGNAQIDTTQYKFGSASILFDGTGDVANIPNSSDFNFGTGDFTIDFWVRFASAPSTGNYFAVVSAFKDTVTYSGWRVLIDENRKVVMSGSADAVSGSTGQIALDTWTHVAISRVSGTCKIYLDGAEHGSGTVNLVDTTVQLRVGATNDSTPTWFMNGWIDELRISKGIGRWSSTFTSPTEAYNEDLDSYTKLCLHGEGADASTIIQDSSSAYKAVTVAGNTQLDTAQKKFGAASILFDGTDDYLTVPDSDDWNFGTGDFTIDFWFRIGTLPTIGNYFYILGQRVDTTHRWHIMLDCPSAATYRLFLQSDNTESISIVNTVTVTTGTWYHAAFVRSGTSIKLYLDGVKQTTDITTSYTMYDLATNLYIGQRNDSIYAFNGWLDELRISKGIARWTADFTPPSASYIEGLDGYTKLCLHGEGADASTVVIDSSSTPKAVTAAGNAQLDTAQKKFGSSAMLFDGTTDYVTVPDSTDWIFGADPYTIDFWVRFTALPAEGQSMVLYCQGTDSDNRLNYQLSQVSGVYQWRATCKIAAATPLVVTTEWPATSIAIDTWYHVAFVRNGTDHKVFQDGVQCGTTVTATYTLPDMAAPLIIGAYISPYTLCLNGWIDEYRVSKGVARWTTTFTPPTLAYSGTAIYEEVIAEALTINLVPTTNVAYYPVIAENITVNTQAGTYGYLYEVTIAENIAVNTTAGFNSGYYIDLDEAFTVSDDSSVNSTMVFTSFDQNFPPFSSESFTGWIDNEQEMPLFDVSGDMIISPVMNASANAPEFSSDSSMLTGIIMIGSVEFSFSSDATLFDNPIMDAGANFPLSKNAGTMSIGGRFVNYILRYTR